MATSRTKTRTRTSKATDARKGRTAHKAKVSAKKSRATNGGKGAKVKVPTAKEVAAFAGIVLKPALATAQVQRLRRGLPGYVNILDDVAELLEEDAVDLNLSDVTPAGLIDVQRRQKDLVARESVLEAAYTSAYHQRLVVDDEAIGMLRAIARRVQSRAEENPDLKLRYKAMFDYLAKFAGGRRVGATKDAGGGDQDEG